MMFTQQVREDATGLVVFLSGEMDYSVSGSFEAAVQRLIAVQRPGLLQVDMSELTFLDSTAVSVIVRLWRLARRENCSLRVVNPTGVVRQVLDATGALAIVGVHPAPDAAR
jgi:anti-anti-sigma factor